MNADMKKPILNRKRFLELRQMDHQQAEQFVEGIYNRGYQKGQMSPRPLSALQRQALCDRLKRVRGVGPVTLDAILSVVDEIMG